MAKLPAGFKKKQDGRYEYRFTVEGKRYSVCGKTVKECREKELKKRQAIEAGTFTKADKLTVSEYFDRWIGAKVGTVKETTIRTDRILLNRISLKRGSSIASLAFA